MEEILNAIKTMDYRDLYAVSDAISSRMAWLDKRADIDNDERCEYLQSLEED